MNAEDDATPPRPPAEHRNRNAAERGFVSFGVFAFTATCVLMMAALAYYLWRLLASV